MILSIILILMVNMEGIFKKVRVLSVLMKVYTIPCHNTGHINVMLVLQSCTDPLQVLPHPPSETFPTSSDGTCDVSNVKVEEDLDMQGEEEVNVKTEEEECIDIKHEDGIYTEEEGEEEKDILTTEDDVKEEVIYICLHVCYKTHFNSIYKHQMFLAYQSI
jgi:hypothetical protein